MSSLFE